MTVYNERTPSGPRIEYVVLGLLVLVLICPRTGRGQSRKLQTPVWISFHGMAYTKTGDIFLAGGIQGQFGQRHPIQIGLNESIDWDRFGLLTAHVAIGRWRRGSSWFAAGFVGPAFVYGGEETDTSDAPFFPVGIAMNTQLVLILLPDMGIGVDLFGILNPDGFHFAPRLMVEFSNIR